MLTLTLTIANKALKDSVTRYIIPFSTTEHFSTQLLSISVIGFSCCPVSIRSLSRTIEAAVRNGPSPAVQHIIMKSNPSRAGLAAKLSQCVHIVCVVKGGQVCVMGPAVTLCFSPALRFIYKVVLVRESWAKGEDCSQKKWVNPLLVSNKVFFFFNLLQWNIGCTSLPPTWVVHLYTWF